MKISFDPDSMTLGDMVDFQKKTGMSVTEAFAPRVKRDPVTGEVEKDGRGRPVKVSNFDPLHLVTMVWLTVRKDDPEYKFEDAFNLKLKDIDFSASGEADPKD